MQFFRLRMLDTDGQKRLSKRYYLRSYAELEQRRLEKLGWKLLEFIQGVDNA